MIILAIIGALMIVSEPTAEENWFTVFVMTKILGLFLIFLSVALTRFKTSVIMTIRGWVNDYHRRKAKRA